MAAGHSNAAIDCEGNLHVWSEQNQIRKVNHGSLTQVCICSGATGLVRDRENNVYEWGAEQDGLQSIRKRVTHIFQGEYSTIIIRRQKQLASRS